MCWDTPSARYLPLAQGNHETKDGVFIAKTRTLGMGSGLETLCGQSYGAKQYHMLGIYLQRSWVIVTAVSLLFVPCYVFATCIFEAIGQPAELAVVAGIVALWSLPIHFSFIFSFTCQMYLQAQSNNKVIVWFAAASIVVHIGLCLGSEFRVS
ncbi:hypothetical protein AMTR_s00060p00070950 [Amborella trichopoda]|uniref:Uncharacterized protein n=1 Tax=Amborella trichopoda TaxID=13333 RepID=W1NJ66_AMBTC|nr:hypothetical protein AMTR_s00060p00070950 [Amborella trichopoda]